jgi:cytochrome c556
MNQPGEMSKDESPFDTEAFHIEIQQIVKAEKVGEQQRDEGKQLHFSKHYNDLH